LEQNDNFITITNKGTDIIKNTTDLLNRNTELVEYIRQVVREFGPYKGKSIKEVVYGLAKVDEKKHIADTEHGEPLLSALSIEQANRRFWLDDEWMETLSILIDKDMCKSLDRGIQDAKEGKIEKYVPLKNIA
jgi:hypothetical protein